MIQFTPDTYGTCPGITIFYKSYNKNPIFFVSQDKKYFLFKINVNYIDWEQLRVILIGFYKNDGNHLCSIGTISKESLKNIITFLGMIKSSNENCTALYV